MKIIEEGFIVVTPTICQGDTISWSVQEDGQESNPLIFTTEKDAWKEIADDMITELQQVINDEREVEDAPFNGHESYVAIYQRFEDGTIIVSDGEGNPIIETTLDEWRKNL